LQTALVGAGVGLLSAILSFIVAVVTIRRASIERREARSQEVALKLLPRRLDAYEQVWQALLIMDDLKPLPEATLGDLLSASLWLPDSLRSALLRLILADAPDAMAVREVRALLLADTAVSNVDRVLERLSRTRLPR
jgi:hypothetical protein